MAKKKAKPASKAGKPAAKDNTASTKSGVSKASLTVASPGGKGIYYIGDKIPVRGTVAKGSYVFVRIQSAGAQANHVGIAARVDNKTGNYSQLLLAPNRLGRYTLVVTESSKADGSGPTHSQNFDIEIRSVVTARVKAVHCLWFFGATAAEGPAPWKDPVSASMPIAIDVPGGTTSIDITVTSATQTWSHGDVSTTTSTLEGYKDEQVRDEYFNFANPSGAGRINRLVAPLPKLNELVGMIATGAGTDTYRQFHVGLGTTVSDGGALLNSPLVLGHHDGYEWKNNSTHDVDVVLEFRAT